MKKVNMKVIVATISVVALGAACFLAWALFLQKQEPVLAIQPPTMPLPAEAASGGITKYSFIAYGDTRGSRDGTRLQDEHSRVIGAMLEEIKRLQGTEYPVKFVLQSGDAVTDGRVAAQWNVSFVPIINRLTTEGGVPYFLTPGNHEATTTET